MLWPLLLMFVASKLYFLGSLLMRARVTLIQQESGKAWVRQALAIDMPSTISKPVNSGALT